MKTFRLVLAICAALLIGFELWNVLVQGDDFNLLSVIAMALVVLSMYVASKRTDRWRVGQRSDDKDPVR